MVQIRHTTEASRRRAPGRALPWLSRRTGFWAIAFSFLAVAAFSTAPSSLYGLYEQQEHLSSLTITIVYAVYALGIVVSLLLAGHVSDWYGRRAVLLPALTVAVVAAVIFLTWRSLAGIIVARVLTGLALGAAVATATAFVTDLDAGPGGVATRRAGIVATIANIGGLALGPLIAGLLARYAGHGLTLPFIVFLALLLAAVGLVIVGPGGPRGHSSAAEVPPAAAQGAGERAQPVPGGHDRGVHGIRCRRAVRRARGDVPGRALAPAFSRADRIDDLPDLRRRRARADHDHELAGPPPACRRDRADDRRPVPAGRLSMDIAAQPRVVPGRRNRRRHRYWRDHSRQPDRGDLHRQPGQSGRRPGDVLHRRLRRRVGARRRGRDHTAAPQSSS